MPHKKLQAVACCILGIAVSGCSSVLPGLHISLPSPGEHEYRIVSDQDSNGYKVTPAAPRPQYEVITITPDVVVKLAQAEAESSAVPSPDLQALLPSDVPPDYKVGPSDIVFPVVWEHPELTQPLSGGTSDLSTLGRVVAADGTIFYPYVGTFKAAGMTTSQIRDYVTERLKKVIPQPQVDVRVVAYRANRIEVSGEVFKPSTLTLDDTPKGVLQAIAAAGGLTPLASRRRAVLVRGGKIIEINLGGLLSGDRPVINPALQAGDVLHIPDQSADQVFVLGAVTKQAPVILTQAQVSLVQALTTAGGLDTLRADQSGVYVFRMAQSDSGPKARVYRLDMSRPEAMLLAGQFELKPRDVVYVDTTGFSEYNAVVSQLLPTVQELFYLFEIHNITK